MSTPLRTLIVEDEPIAARTLQRMLADVATDVEVAGIVGTVVDAVAWLRREAAPDLIFLDVQLGDGLSFEIFDQLEPPAPVVFTTAHDAYALRAFDVFGIDYLLKPLDPKRLAGTLDRFRRLRSLPPLAAAARHYREATQQFRQRFLVRSGERLLPIEIDAIAYFSKELVVRLVTRDGRGHPLSQSLDVLQAELDPAVFFRANRQILLNRTSIAAVQRLPKGKLALQLQPTTPQAVIVSQERAGAFRAWLAG